MLLNPYRFGAGGPPADEHRYWRIFVTTGESFYVGFSEVRLLNESVNQSTGGTAAASSSYAGLYPGNAFDGNTATDWANNGGFPAWLSYDFGVPKPVDTVEIRARAYQGQGPTNFKIQYSDNNSIWVDAVTVIGAAAWGSLELRSYAV